MKLARFMSLLVLIVISYSAASYALLSLVLTTQIIIIHPLLWLTAFIGTYLLWPKERAPQKFKQLEPVYRELHFLISHTKTFGFVFAPVIPFIVLTIAIASVQDGSVYIMLTIIGTALGITVPFSREWYYLGLRLHKWSIQPYLNIVIGTGEIQDVIQETIRTSKDLRWLRTTRSLKKKMVISINKELAVIANVKDRIEKKRDEYKIRKKMEEFASARDEVEKYRKEFLTLHNLAIALFGITSFFWKPRTYHRLQSWQVNTGTELDPYTGSDEHIIDIDLIDRGMHEGVNRELRKAYELLTGYDKEEQFLKLISANRIESSNPQIKSHLIQAKIIVNATNKVLSEFGRRPYVWPSPKEKNVFLSWTKELSEGEEITLPLVA